MDVSADYYYDYTEEQEYIPESYYITTSIGPASSSFSEEIEGFVRVISLDANDEFWFYIAPGYVTEDSSVSTSKTIHYSDTEDKLVGFDGISTGGGDVYPCEADLSDDVLSPASICKLYFSEDSSGTYTDSAYKELDNGFENRIRTVTWTIEKIE